MKSENPTMRLLGGTIRIALLLIAALFVIRVAKVFYGYGYEIFAQTPMSEAPGRTVTVTVEKGDSVSDIGKMLEEKGLIQEDPLGLLFRLQERFSEFHGKIVPGTYELTSAMTPDEMIAVMSANNASVIMEGEDGIAEGNSELGVGIDSEDQVPPSEELPEGYEGYAEDLQDADVTENDE